VPREPGQGSSFADSVFLVSGRATTSCCRDSIETSISYRAQSYLVASLIASSTVPAASRMRSTSCSECAVVKFLAAQGSPELAPYICPVDILYSEALGWGLRRTTTLAEGSVRCDFRFKKGGETRVNVPKSLAKYIEGRV
jgi:hypothetical protein